jgi:hypothetical protein
MILEDGLWEEIATQGMSGRLMMSPWMMLIMYFFAFTGGVPQFCQWLILCGRIRGISFQIGIMKEPRVFESETYYTET